MKYFRSGPLQHLYRDIVPGDRQFGRGETALQVRQCDKQLIAGETE